MSPPLQIRLLGQFSVAIDGATVSGLNSARLQSLLAFLLLNRAAPQSRQQLAFLFWPETSDGQAQTNLRQLLHTLRHRLPAVDEYLVIDERTIRWLEPADFGSRWEAAKSDPEKAPEVFSFNWTPDVIDPYSYLFNLFHTEKTPLWNLGFYSNPDFDALIDQARRQSAVDQTEATTSYIAAQRMLNDEATAIYVLDLPDLNIIAADIQGFQANPAYSHMAYWYDLRRER